jgi:hypothetical protein
MLMMNILTDEEFTLKVGPNTSLDLERRSRHQSAIISALTTPCQPGTSERAGSALPRPSIGRGRFGALGVMGELR